MSAAPSLIYRQRLRWLAFGELAAICFMGDFLSQSIRSAAMWQSHEHHPALEFICLGLMRAQFGLLCVWLLAGIDPLPWRLAGFIIGCSWLYWIFTGLPFRRVDEARFFVLQNTGLDYQLLYCPLQFLTLAAVLLGRWLYRSRSARRADSASVLPATQFSVLDYLVVSLAIGIFLMVGSWTPEGKFMLWKEAYYSWQAAILLRDLELSYIIFLAIPTAATILLACHLSCRKWPLSWKLGLIAAIGLGIGLAVNLLWLAGEATVLQNRWVDYRIRQLEALSQPLIGVLVLLGCWFVAGYDSFYRRVNRRAAQIPVPSA